MAHAIEVRTALDDDAIEQLAALLCDAVADGASVSFLSPVPRDDARAFWRRQEVGPRGAIICAVDGGRVDGVVMLQPAWAPNQPHRADVAKLIVHPRARRAGLGRRLMEALVAHARAQGFTLLVLDTVRGGVADGLYRRLGWQVGGVIPDYALDPRGALCDTVIFYLPLGPLAPLAPPPAP